jgi:hypothetical protein
MIKHARTAFVVGGATFVGALAPTAALAREELSVDVAAGGAASTNPFLDVRGKTGSPSAFVEVSPLLTIEDEVSTVSLRGQGRVEQFNHGRTEESALVDLDVNRRETDRLSLRAGARFHTSRGSARDVLTSGTLGLEPLPGVIPELTDVSFVGRRTRTSVATARLGASYALSDRESLDGDLSVGVNRFKDPLLFDYRFANQEVGYTRALSQRTSLNLSVGLSEVDYARGRAGDSVTVTPLVGFTRQLSESTRGSISIGASHSRVRRADGSTDGKTGFALRGNLCNTQVRGRICLDAERSAQPTAIGDVSTLTSFRITGSRQLSSRDTLNLTARASRSAGTGGFLVREKAWFVGASAELARKFDPRLEVFGRGSFADIYDRTPSPRADLRGELGVRYRFGALR